MTRIFKSGDIVKLTNITEDDALHGRYVGETAIFQEYEPTIMEEGNSLCYVRFDEPLWAGYCVLEKSLELVEPATIKSIFAAFCEDGETELIERVEEYCKLNR
jgi:hypothetical protein